MAPAMQALGFNYDCEGSCEGECHRWSSIDGCCTAFTRMVNSCRTLMLRRIGAAMQAIAVRFHNGLRDNTDALYLCADFQ